ncbi:hypothetical protein GW17_00042977 [Ensete ventricosum]|nr:hypothetical protein GW17_00042977 [Ensete ventricosum]
MILFIRVERQLSLGSPVHVNKARKSMLDTCSRKCPPYDPRGRTDHLAPAPRGLEAPPGNRGPTSACLLMPVGPHTTEPFRPRLIATRRYPA